MTINWDDKDATKAMMIRLADAALLKMYKEESFDHGPFHAVIKEIGKSRYISLAAELAQEKGETVSRPLSMAAVSYKG